MLLNREETWILAAREWNEAQQKVVESFQHSQRAAGDGWIWPVAALVAAALLLAAFNAYRRRR